MPKLDLPSGGWVEYRDKLKASDKFAVQEAIVVTIGDDRSTDVTGGLQNKMRNALLTAIITSWSFPEPIPSAPGGLDIGTLDLDDYNALEVAVEPLMEKVSFAPPPKASGK